MAYNNIRSRAISNGYRSGLEEDIATQLKDAGVAAEYEPFRLPYTQPAKDKKYTPDYVLPNGIIIESKGRFMLDDRKKHIDIRNHYGPELDLRFVFNNSKSKLSKGAKSTYADWCDKHGFMYAKREIPVSWLKEKANKKSLTLITRIRSTK